MCACVRACEICNKIGFQYKMTLFHFHHHHHDNKNYYYYDYDDDDDDDDFNTYNRATIK